MNPELQQLKDIHLPSAIPMWPIAPGWLILFILFLASLMYLIYLSWRRYLKKKPIRFALARLKILTSENPENTNIAAELSTLIRRTALSYFHREEIAGLSGHDWLHFLNQSGETTKFTEEIGLLLLDQPYRKRNTADLTPLFELIKMWLLTIAKRKNVLMTLGDSSTMLRSLEK